MRVCFDTSVIIAALLPRHPAHAASARWLRRAGDREVRGFLSAHGFAEAYAVLTAMPAQPRISPGDARRLLRESVEPRLTLVTVPAATYKKLLDRLNGAGIGGGAVYDGLHLEAAERAGAERVLTLDLADFVRVRPDWSDRIAAP